VHRHPVDRRTVPHGRRTSVPTVAADLGADYKRLRRSSAIAAFGEGLVAVALPLIVVGLTNDPVAVAAVVAVQHLPWVVLAAVGSRLMRTVDRRTTVGAVETVRAVVVGLIGYLVLIDAHTLMQLYAVALVVGLGEILRDDGEADGADALARGEDQPEVIGGLSGRGMVALGVALIAGGFLYRVLAAAPLLVNLGVFSLAGLAVLAVRRPMPPTGSGTAGAAIDALRREGPALEPGTALPTAVAALSTMATSAVLGVLVLFALENLQLDAPGFGLLLAVLAGGAAFGGLASPGLGGRIGIRPALVVLLVVAAAGYVAASILASPEQPYLAAAALVVSSAAAMAASVIVRALLHAGAGRTLEQASIHVFHLVVWAAIPVGAMAGGFVGRATGVPGVLVAAAVVAVAAAAVAMLVKPAPPADEEPADPPSSPRSRSFSTS
jgi:hypothetical protein